MLVSAFLSNIVDITFIVTLVRLLFAAIAQARANKRKLINDIAERYIEATKANGFSDTRAARMFALQCAGAAALKGESDVGRLFRIVTMRGCTLPLVKGDWPSNISQRSLPAILHEASAKGHRLSSDKAIFGFFMQCIFDAQQKVNEDNHNALHHASL